MTVEVIGKDPENTFEITCRKCASILRYAKRDVFTFETTYCGKPETERAIECPSCGNFVVL